MWLDSALIRDCDTSVVCEADLSVCHRVGHRAPGSVPALPLLGRQPGHLGVLSEPQSLPL